MALIRQFINGLTLALNVAGTVGIILLMLLINADVIGRSFFDQPISGVPEIVSLSIVAIVFLQIAAAYRRGKLTRTDAFPNWLRKRAPRMAQILELLFSVAALCLVTVLFWSSQPLFQKAWQRDTYVGTVGDFIAPIWPVKLVLLIGCAALILQIALRLTEQVNNLVQGRSDQANAQSSHDSF